MQRGRDFGLHSDQVQSSDSKPLDALDLSGGQNLKKLASACKIIITCLI
jgi:hypothetical protein